MQDMLQPVVPKAVCQSDYSKPSQKVARANTVSKQRYKRRVGGEEEIVAAPLLPGEPDPPDVELE